MSHRLRTLEFPKLRFGVVVVAVLLASCSTTSDPTANPDDAAVEAADGNMERFYDQTIDFGACAEFATNDVEEQTFANDIFECGRLTVPLDYTVPQGETAQIC